MQRGVHAAYLLLEPWSGEERLSVDRSLPHVLHHSAAESWSNAHRREDRTAAPVGITPRIAESWSHAPSREDRTPATVDIRAPLPTMPRPARAAVTIAAVAAAVFLAAPNARADGGGNAQGRSSTAQDANANASADQSGAQNSNSTIRNGQGGNDGMVTQQNGDASAASAGAATDAAGGNGPQSSNASADASAAQTSAGNDNADVRVGSPGDTAATDQSNDVQAGAAASATDSGCATPNGAGPQSPNASATPQGACDKGPSANATANATQKDARNQNVTVRVDSPGDLGPTSQSNTAAAGVTASDNGGSGASATSGAQAQQTSPTNVNVVVRVGSPGDNGTVLQQNTVAASGTTAPSPPSAAGDTAAPAATTQTVSTSGEADGTNVATTDQTVDQRQGGDPPSVGESPPSPSSGADPAPTKASASAAQTGAANINVSVRIGSPGADGPSQQSNHVSATGSAPELGVTTTDGGTNTNVTVVIPGSTSPPPGDAWSWNWVWDGSWTPPPGATAQDTAPTNDSSWDWNWSTTPTAGAPPPDDPTGEGTFTWRWTWTTPDGQTSTSTNEWACNCNWDWSWTWDWSSGAPSSTTTSAPDATASSTPQTAQTFDIAPVTQQNSTDATAEAVTEVDLSQTVDRSTGPDGATADNLVLADQVAEADASASTVDAENVNVDWGVAADPVTQANTVEANAFAYDHLDATQVAIQRQWEAEGTSQAMSSTQRTDSTQTAVAVAVAASVATANANRAWATDPSAARVGFVAQRNGAAADATSVDWADALQWSQQFQSAGESTAQSEQAIDLLRNAQDARAVAVASQTDTVNVDDVFVPAGSRATNPSLSQQNLDAASSTSINYSHTEQWISQTQNGEAVDESSYAVNLSSTDQYDDESVAAVQLDLTNRSGWLGVEPAEETAGTPSVIVPALSVGSNVLDATTVASTRPPAAPAPRATPAFPQLRRSAPHTNTHLRSGSSAAGALGTASRARTAAAHAAVPSVRRSSRNSAGVPAPAPFRAALTAGSAGPAPGTGGGLVAISDELFTLAAPAHLGPRLPASALGPPMRTADPIERPG